MPKVSQEHLDARRAQILDGARRAFARWGYAGATVARLEEETGLSRGAIFHYFRGKQDLFVALAIEVNRHYTGLAVEHGLDEALRAMAAESPDWLGVLLETQARLRHDEGFQRRTAEAMGDTTPRLLGWFEARQADGTFRGDVPALELARFATMILNGLGMRVVAGDRTDVDATLALLHDALAPRQ